MQANVKVVSQTECATAEPKQDTANNSPLSLQW